MSANSSKAVLAPQPITKAPGRSLKFDWSQWWQQKGVRWAIRAAAIVLALLFWQLASVYQWNYLLSFENVPAPADVGAELWVQLQTSEFYTHILVSLQRIGIGYALAVVLGVAIGVLMGRFRFMEDFCLPYIEILRPIPAVAWIPMAILI